MSAEAVPAGAVVAGGAHVFADAGIDRHAAAITVVIDPAFLAEAGWDPARKVLSFAPEHPLLGRPVCRAAGCSTSAPAATRICASCRRRLAEHGLGDDQIASLPPRGRERSGRGPDACVVDGCGREWESASSGLCRAHAEQLRALPVTDVDEFLAHRQTRPLPPCAPCAVAACTRQRRHPDGLYCGAHQQRLRTVRARDPHLDETQWRATEPAIGRGGEVSLRGLPPLVVAELLVGCSSAAGSTRSRPTRPCCARSATTCWRQQVGSITDYVIGDGRGLEFTGLVNCLIGHARRALSTPETEVAQDEWDLTVFGHPARCRLPASARPGCGRPPNGGPPTTCPSDASDLGGAPALAWPCVTTSAAWCGCRSRCGCAPTAANTQRRWAAPTWRRSCTGWPTWNRSDRSAATPGSEPAARFALCSPASAQWG